MIYLFCYIFHMCVFLFCGECGCICMISICVTDNQCVISVCMAAISMNADRPLLTIWPICMIIICITAHQCVITDYDQQSV